MIPGIFLLFWYLWTQKMVENLEKREIVPYLSGAPNAKMEVHPFLFSEKCVLHISIHTHMYTYIFIYLFVYSHLRIQDLEKKRAPPSKFWRSLPKLCCMSSLIKITLFPTVFEISITFLPISIKVEEIYWKLCFASYKDIFLSLLKQKCKYLKKWGYKAEHL